MQADVKLKKTPPPWVPPSGRTRVGGGQGALVEGGGEGTGPPFLYAPIAYNL